MSLFRRLLPHHRPSAEGQEGGPAKVILGLGNPGGEYEMTRHNVGFLVVDVLSDRLHLEVRRTGLKCLRGETRAGDHRVILAKPLTYMNLSGQAARGLLDYYRLSPRDLLVVTDDVNLPVGRLRLRADGSAGGHNGLKSLIQCLGTQEFPRLRIGVGAPVPGTMIHHVLGRFPKEEMPAVRDAVHRAADAVECLLAEGLQEAMNRFNVRPPE
ncbi:MAG TPA: aminoacyl-tRNA hydrolase [Armatimonadota bacterium]|jgi:PTH1 family peptidyl-tRNA hydrolase